MPLDVNLQLDLAVRLLVASALGAAIGLEREIHEHPAGMRTHLLVALGSALFTVVSIYGFVGLLLPAEGALPEPTRIASNIVTGIGFLGAGAILKYGTAVHGLTTAASLWATAAVGMAIGTGSYVMGLVTAAIVLICLWPLQRLADRVRTRRRLRIRVGLKRLDALGDVFEALTGVGAEVEAVRTKRLADDQFVIDFNLHLARGAAQGGLATVLSKLPDVQLLEGERAAE